MDGIVSMAVNFFVAVMLCNKDMKSLPKVLSQTQLFMIDRWLRCFVPAGALQATVQACFAASGALLSEC